MTDIGDDVKVTTKVYVDGQLADPGSITLTVTSPSGTTSTPTPSNDSTGVWSATFNTDEAGRWQYVWTTTAPAGVEHGYVDVQADPPPRLQPLATPQDLAALLGRDLTDTEQARAAALLRAASAKIRAYTRQDFDHIDDDQIVLRPVGSHLRLPQRPVTAVTQIVALGGAGLADFTLPSGSWQWDGVDLVELWPLEPDVWINLPFDWPERTGYGPDTYRVTYSHGYAVTPDDVVDVCCQMVLRTLTAPTTADGLVQETIGQYSYQYGQGPGAQSPGAGVKMTEDDRRALKRYTRPASTVALRVR